MELSKQRREAILGSPPTSGRVSSSGDLPILSQKGDFGPCPCHDLFSIENSPIAGSVLPSTFSFESAIGMRTSGCGYRLCLATHFAPKLNKYQILSFPCFRSIVSKIAVMASDRPIPLDVLNLKFGSNFHLDLELQCVPDHIIHSPRPGATAVRFRIDIQ